MRWWFKPKPATAEEHEQALIMNMLHYYKRREEELYAVYSAVPQDAEYRVWAVAFSNWMETHVSYVALDSYYKSRCMQKGWVP